MQKNQPAPTLPAPAFYTIAAVAARTSLSRRWIYNLIKSNEFPKPVKIGAKAVRWPADSVEAWISRQTEGGVK